MSVISAIYGTETVSHWENSSLDARIYEAEDASQSPTLIDMDAMVEATYHAALAGDVASAAAILYNHLYGGARAWLTSVAGKYEVALDILSQFYPSRDLMLDPRTGDPQIRCWIMHETSVCLHVVGRLGESASIAARAAAAASALNDEHNAGITYHNLAETFLASGALDSCQAVADSALDLATRSGNREDALVAHTIRGRLGDLTCSDEAAESSYIAALRIAVEDTAVPMLYSLSGVRYAEHLLTSNKLAEALNVARDNLHFCQEQGWQSDVALIKGLVSVIPSDIGNEQLQMYSEEAVDVARALGGKQVLTETLLARSEFTRRRNMIEESLAASDEALSISQSFGFRRAEVDARTIRGAVFGARHSSSNARAEGMLARDLAMDLGYKRGQVSAEELLSALESPGPLPSP